jgi:hypothetical protein
MGELARSNGCRHLRRTPFGAISCASPGFGSVSQEMRRAARTGTAVPGSYAVAPDLPPAALGFGTAGTMITGHGARFRMPCAVLPISKS